MKIKFGYYLNYLSAVFGFNQPQKSCETRKYCIEFIDPCPCPLFSHEHLTVAGFNRNVNQNSKTYKFGGHYLGSVMAEMEHKQKELYYVLINYITENTVRSDRSIASQFARVWTGIFWNCRTFIVYYGPLLRCLLCVLSILFIIFWFYVHVRVRFFLTHCDDKLGLREFDELTYSQYCFLSSKI